MEALRYPNSECERKDYRFNPRYLIFIKLKSFCIEFDKHSHQDAVLITERIAISLKKKRRKTPSFLYFPQYFFS